MFYVVNNHINNLYVLSNKAVGPEKNPKLINLGHTYIPESRIGNYRKKLHCRQIYRLKKCTYYAGFVCFPPKSVGFRQHLVNTWDVVQDNL